MNPGNPARVGAPGGRPFAVPWPAALITLVFLCINLAVTLNPRGVADPEGYLLNNSKALRVNTYEDDGILSLKAVLGQTPLGQDFSSYYFNFGGAVLHLGRAVFLLAESGGLIKIFDDPVMYVAYPKEFERVWILYGLYKLFFFVAWLPVLAYWIGANGFSRRAGILAALFVASMPFIPGFEQRIKPDGMALAVGLAALLLQILAAKGGGRRMLYWAAAASGLALSIKFTMLPLVATQAAAHLLIHDQSRRGILQAMAVSAACAALAFVGTNIRVIPGIWPIVSNYVNYVAAPPQALPESRFFTSMFERLANFEPLAGPGIHWLMFPVLLFGLARSAAGRRQAPVLLLTLFFATYMLYMYAFIREGILSVTYYFYAPTVVWLVMAAACLDSCAAWLGERFQGGKTLVLGLAALLAASALVRQAGILNYFLAPTNRQEAHAWLARNAPPMSAVGVPLAPGRDGLNALMRVDPFVYSVLNIGPNGKLAGTLGLDYVLWMENAEGAPHFVSREYGLAAFFDRGADLSGQNDHNLFQEEIYSVYQRLSGVGPDKPSARTIEAALGQYVRSDTEAAFNIAAHQSLNFFPLNIALFRKSGPTLLPVPTKLFGTTLKPDGQLTHMHDVAPELLRLWGVKYVLAKSDPQSEFARLTAADPLYGLTPVKLLESSSNGEARSTMLYRNEAYAGQALFLPDREPLARFRHESRVIFPSRGRVASRGVLARGDVVADKSCQLLEIEAVLESSGTMDLIVTGGPRRQSTLIGAGVQRVRFPYATGARREDIRYEINPVKEGDTFTIREITVLPMKAEALKKDAVSSLGLDGGFARVRAQGPGRVLFSLPWHPYWTAEVDRKPAPVLRGPGNTVTVPVPDGEHFVSVRLK